MAILKQHPTLPDLQEYLKLLCKERQWENDNPLEIFLLLSEEVGELAKAIRNKIKLYHEEGKVIKEDELEDEIADVLSYLLDLANKFDIDIETAFRNKEAKNAKRVWN